MKSLHENFTHIEEEIAFLKKKRNAIILSHFYQDEDIQDIADFIGDSLDLSKKAQKTEFYHLCDCVHLSQNNFELVC